MEDKKRNIKDGFNRRKFLGSSLAATMALATGNSVFSQKMNKTQHKKKNDEHPYNERTHKAMPTQNLGKTGFQVGILSLGGQATIEKKGKEDESVEIVNKAIDLGINYIDTAAAYGKDENWERALGTSERHIGLVMKGRRHEVFLASKTHDRTYDGSMKLLETSLKNLQTDHLDIWQLHNVKRQDQVDQIFSKNGAIKALEKARSEGMVRFLGITGHYEPLILVQALERYDFDTILMAVNAADPNYLSFKKYLLPVAQTKGIGIIGMKLASRGRLLSTWTPPPLDKQRESMRTTIPGTITMKESLYYNFSLPISTNILGVDNVEQVEQNVKWASEFSPLNNEQLAHIEYKTLPIVRQGLYFRRWELGE
jgi:aryl-alcohol dehydrogenase-like predicted oxidoreductase